MGTLMKSVKGFRFHLSKPSLAIGADVLMNEKAYHTFFSFTRVIPDMPHLLRAALR